MVLDQLQDQVISGAAIDKHECGDNENIKPLESSSPSASESSLKLCSGVDHSPDSSAKDDSDLQTTVLNLTYAKIDADDEGNSQDINESQNLNESEFVTDENSLQLLTSKDFNETCGIDPASWLHCAFVNLSNNFESSRLFAIDSDTKIEESRLFYENMDDCWMIRARNYLADYQALRGTPRDEYTFCHLIKLMGHASGHSLQALYAFILNIIPVLELFLHIARFILDKAISITNAKDTQNMFVNSVVFGIELIIVYICINIIFGCIVSPVIRIPFGILGKMLLYT